MFDLERTAKPVVIEFPAEFDISHAGAVAGQLRAAIAPEGGTVVADLTTTAFCDSSGIRVLMLAREWATAESIELRLAVLAGPTLVVLKMIGLDQLVPVYPSLAEALAGASSGSGEI